MNDKILYFTNVNINICDLRKYLSTSTKGEHACEQTMINKICIQQNAYLIGIHDIYFQKLYSKCPVPGNEQNVLIKEIEK